MYKIDENTSDVGEKRYQTQWSYLSEDIISYFILYKTILLNTIRNSYIDVNDNSIPNVIQSLIYFLMRFIA